MRKLMPLFAVGLLLCTLSMASAQGWYYADQEAEEVVGPEQGMWELSIAGAWFDSDSPTSSVVSAGTSSSDDDEWFALARASYFLTGQISVGAMGWGNDDIQNAALIGAFHIGKATSAWVPYLFGGVGHRWVDDSLSTAVLSAGVPADMDDWLWIAGGGVKYYPNPKVNFFVEFGHTETDDTNVETDMVTAGVSFLSRK